MVASHDHIFDPPTFTWIYGNSPWDMLSVLACIIVQMRLSCCPWMQRMQCALCQVDRAATTQWTNGYFVLAVSDRLHSKMHPLIVWCAVMDVYPIVPVALCMPRLRIKASLYRTTLWFWCIHGTMILGLMDQLLGTNTKPLECLYCSCPLCSKSPKSTCCLILNSKLRLPCVRQCNYTGT